MKKMLLAATALAGIAAPALAADLPVKAPPIVVVVHDWAGFYLGVSGGYGWGRSEHVFDPGNVSHGTLTPNGGLFGGTAGYNWRAGGAWLFGVEGDVSAARLRDQRTLTGAVACTAPGGCLTNVDALSTFRGRVGWVRDAILVYVTGGLAVGSIEAAEPSFTAGGRATRTGWTWGGGAEIKLAPRWSAKAEYLYVDLGTARDIYGLPVATPHHVDFRANIVRLGINWHFSAPVVARY